MSNAISGLGTKFKRGNGASSETFAALAEVKNIKGPTMTRAFIDVTNLDSSGGYREFITGFRDGGEITFSMNFTFDNYNKMLDDFQDEDTHNYQVVLPDTGATTLQFAGLVTGIPLNITFEDAVTIDVTIKISGAVDLQT